MVRCQLMEILRLPTKLFRDPGGLKIDRSGKIANGPAVLVQVEHVVAQRPTRLLQRIRQERRLASRSLPIAIGWTYDFATSSLRGCRTCPLHEIAKVNEEVRICGGLRLIDSPREMRGNWDGKTCDTAFHIRGVHRLIRRPRKSASPGMHKQWEALPQALCTKLPEPPAYLTR